MGTNTRFLSPASGEQDLADRRNQWVDQRLSHRLIAQMAGTLWFNPLIMPLTAWLLWDDSAHRGVAVWLCLGAFITAARWWAVWRYRRLDLPGEFTPLLTQHITRCKAIWIASALHWSGLTWVFFGSAPLNVEFVMWTILVGVGTVAVNSYSANATLLKSYLACLASMPVVALMAAAAGAIPTHHDLGVLLGLLLLSAVFIWTCLSAGMRNHAFQRHVLDLQFDNEQLIASLDRQTKQTQEAMTSRSRLLAGAAHDLRQPVMAMSLFADWLRADPSMASEILPKILQSAAAVNRLFDGLFGLAELDQQSPAPALELVDLSVLLHSLTSQYEAQARARSLTLRVRCPPNAWVMSDERSLRRILGNLMDNAIKYTNEGGVLLTCRSRPGAWQLDVWDTGCGIADDQLEKVFTEFYRVVGHAGTQDSFGLGLAIVKQLSQRIGARIQVRSHLGRGSCFRVSLPRTPSGPSN